MRKVNVLNGSLRGSSFRTLLRPDVPPLFTIGTSTDVTIRGFAELVIRIGGFEGTIVFDSSRPDGTPQRLMDTRRLNALGWRSTIKLEEGIRRTYEELSASTALKEIAASEQILLSTER